jgi:hypothetical protein
MSCCIMLIVVFIAPLDPTHEEPELEAQVEQVEEANPEPNPGKPECITSQS